MPRKLGYNYKKVKVSGSLSINQLANLGFYENKLYKIKRANFRLDTRLLDLNKWKFIGSNSGSTFFKLPNGQKVVVKPEVWVPFPPMKIGKRQSNWQPRKMLAVMNELMRRGVEIDVPLGELIAKERVRAPGSKKEVTVERVFYVTKVKKGINYNQYYFSHASGKWEELAPVVKSMAVFLADMHKKGVVHGHPHEYNWLVHEGKAELVDSKGVSFKEEYPWTANTGRAHTWEEAKQNDFDVVETIIPSPLKDEFKMDYLYELSKKIKLARE